MRSLIFVAAAAAFLMVGCTKKEEAAVTGKAAVGEKAVDTAKGAVGAAVAAATEMEVGCAKCTYKVETADHGPAVKIGDKVYALSGPGLAGKEHDFCAAPKKATITGKIDGDKFVATKIDFK